MRFHLRTRLVFLGVVNGLILLHIVAYYVFDRTDIGCVDFFGLATFAGKGQITAGTVFLGALILVTLALGRVFCGWGCHFALFQDLLVRFFDRIGLRVPFRRSRLELIVPPLLLFVTLLYPVLAWWRRSGVPDTVGVELGYPEVWHLLPGVKGVVLILLVDVVLLTLLFGGRAFCRYVCPYGLFLKPLHALSPVRVTKTGDCSGCGTCARACPTGVPIKYEVETFGIVHDLNCMNCGDCVAACPSGVLSLRATRRAYRHGLRPVIAPSNHPYWTEGVMLASAGLGLFLFRGREFGDFLSVGMGLTAGGTAVIAMRPRSIVRLLQKRPRPSIRTLRMACSAVSLFLALGLVGQAVGWYAARRTQGCLETGDYESLTRVYTVALPAMRAMRPFTFYLDGFPDRAGSFANAIHADADRFLLNDAWADAARAYNVVVLLDPDRIAAYGNRGTALLKDGRFWEAAQSYLRVLEHDPNDLIALYHLAITQIHLKQHGEALSLVQRILDIDTVGHAYDLIRENPAFQLLETHAEYRRCMAAYALMHSGRATGNPRGENP